MAKIEKTCAGCDRSFLAYYKTQRFCSRPCWLTTYNTSDAEHTLLGAENGSKAIGDKMRGTGVGYVKRSGRHEHRIVAEKMLGRPLLPGEIVHHRDENKSNNDPKNLEVMTQSEHIRLHLAKMCEARKVKHGW